MRFFVGLHHPSDAKHFDAAFISVNALSRRKGPFTVRGWIMDSGAFTTIMKNGGYPESPSVYAGQIRRWAGNGNLLAAVAQDYMCEPHMIAKTGLTIADHQRLTIERYDEVCANDCGGVYIMPVLQGYAPNDYVAHIRQYGDRLASGAWVGVGSVCKRNGNPAAIEEVLLAIKRERPDLRLHGFGVKRTSLASGLIRSLLYSADSMAWSFAARVEGRNGNDWREARRYIEALSRDPVQYSIFETLIGAEPETIERNAA
jgi:hypothetical protein